MATIAECARWYLEEHIDRRSGNPSQVHRNLRRVMPYVGTSDAAAWSQRDLMRAWDACFITPSARRNCFLMVRAAIGWAVKTGRIPSQSFLRVPSTNKIRGRRAMTQAELALIASDLPNWRPELRLWWLMSWYTGQRIQAILGLTWDKWDPSTGLLDFRPPSDGKRYKGRAVVPAHQDLVDALSLTPRTSDSIIHLTGKLETRRAYVTKYFRERLRTIGVDDSLTPHYIRHTVASVVAAQDIRQAQQLLGHKSILTTERTYAHFHPSHLLSATQALGKVFAR